MLDLHCHILPGVDDGASTLAESLAMAKEAEQQGITCIVATPHHKNGAYENTKADILASVEHLNEELKKADVNVDILPGQEIRVYGELLEDYEKGELLTIAGMSPYLFIEFPSGSVPHYTEQLFYDIQMKGILPVIVHPERNSEFMQKPDRLYSLVKNGAATQVTAASYIGKFGRKIQHFTEQLIEANLTHLLASDAHNTSSRSFKLVEAYTRLANKLGDDHVFYFQENAKLLVSGEHLHKEPPEKIHKKKKLLGIF
ncbi:tyrosine-protein phosphatase [Pseudobacillus badius]|uniref:tyrosine-protein phosphatase n=1 Tax=Bacillus badius TaxID=1455 RepID=UPI0007B05D24|nr:CpsB/CapC family capsule biosynthesis tyrosine phosphatase [Bacillus badius]KZO00014.1 tyrosine protein phosphatase [Bacillus badius]OCS86175.1 tyrosine protein phosphatase [Bacillus badius]OVE52364.1 tyrosine protein phosphatase [Bacillus badius]TDW04095.1 protein-tyrosine phosphatase [Bacillus badius]UAT30492.1 tyrosine protein phosphatase [Bacillus badius]